MDVNNLVHTAKHTVKLSSLEFQDHVDDDSLDEDGQYMQAMMEDDDRPHGAYKTTMDDAKGLMLSIVFNSLQKSYLKFKANHFVACFDNYSWRREFYEDYKANRRNKDKTPAAQKLDEVVMSVLLILQDFLSNYTNVTVLEQYGIEADDFIGRWVKLHDDPSFMNMIVSSDGDFKQLVSSNTELFDPVRDTLYTLDGVFYQDGKRKKRDAILAMRYDQEWKVKLDKQDNPVMFDPKWELFRKCIRGDSSDNIKSAFPRVRETRLRSAYDNPGTIEWNNLMNESWGEEGQNVVKDRYNFNRRLIDLTCQPTDIVEIMDYCIEQQIDKDRKQLVGSYFTKFCGKYKLNKLHRNGDGASRLLSAVYD